MKPHLPQLDKVKCRSGSK